MKKTIEINYGTSITLNRGNYENFKPMWHQKTTLELNGETPEQVQALEEAEFSRLKSRMDKYAEDEWNKSKAENSGVRIRIKDGKKYPSVTSILNPDFPANIDPEYAVRGTEIHRLCNEFIKTGKWQEPQVPLQKLSYQDIAYEEFFTKFNDRIDFEKAELNQEIFNEKHSYSGEIDCLCFVDGIRTLVDFKTGQWSWTQLIAYYKAHNTVKQLAIFDLKKVALEVMSLKDIKCIDHWENFLIKRGEFKSRFGI